MLTVHTDKGRRVSQDELPRIVTTPRGDRSERWQGIPHATLVDAMGEEIQRIGYKVRNTEFVLSGSKHGDPQSCLVGGFELDTDGYGGLGQTVSQCLAFMHDNAGSRSLRIFTGGTVEICMNGLVCAEDESRRKHTTGLQLQTYLRMRFNRLHDMFAETQAELDSLSRHRITLGTHDRLLLTAARQGALSWSALGKVDQAWKDAHNGREICWEQEGHKGEWPFKNTAWDWLNAGTHVLKSQSPTRQLAKIQDLQTVVHSFLSV